MTVVDRRVSRWLLAMLLLIAPSLAAAAPEPVPIGKNGDVELSKPARIGDVTLQPGFYRLQHQEQDGNHVLVVKQRTAERRGRQSYGVGPGTEIARVPCQVVPLDKKTSGTELHLRNEPDGSTAITQIRIRGERSSHVLALEPKVS